MRMRGLPAVTEIIGSRANDDNRRGQRRVLKKTTKMKVTL